MHDKHSFSLAQFLHGEIQFTHPNNDLYYPAGHVLEHDFSHLLFTRLYPGLQVKQVYLSEHVKQDESQ